MTPTQAVASSIVLYHHHPYRLFNLNNGNRDDEGKKKGQGDKECVLQRKYKHFKKTSTYAHPQKHPEWDLKEDKKGN